jgi:hypothetical protein
MSALSVNGAEMGPLIVSGAELGQVLEERSVDRWRGHFLDEALERRPCAAAGG